MPSISNPSLKTNYILNGSKDFPEVITIFMKDASGHIQMIDEQAYNDLGHNPLNFMTAIEKIKVATGIIFEELKGRSISNENNQFSLALKNLGRGFIQLIPLIGNLALIIYDRIRISCFIHPTLKHALYDSSNEPVVGIAFDSKPLFMIPITSVNSSSSKVGDRPLKIINYMWLRSKSDQLKKINNNQKTDTDLELARRLEPGIRSVVKECIEKA